jgi:hypothetical protein
MTGEGAHDAHALFCETCASPKGMLVAFIHEYPRAKVFPEIHIQFGESLCVRIGANRRFALRWARWGTQHVAPPNTCALGEDLVTIAQRAKAHLQETFPFAG